MQSIICGMVKLMALELYSNGCLLVVDAFVLVLSTMQLKCPVS